VIRGKTRNSNKVLDWKCGIENTVEVRYRY